MVWAVDLCESIVNAINQEIDLITGENSENISLQGMIRWIVGGGGWAALAGGIGSLWGLVKRLTGNPLEVNLKKYLEHPQYADRVSFIDQLHNDFQKIVSAYTGKKRIYIFIDDLDRCVIPKAAELMESINLMLSDNPNLVFIMGMDREKVAAGLAVKHEKLLPYLSGWAVNKEVADKDYDKNKRIKGIRYGYSFIEKFVQVPFVLPIPRQDRIKEMLLELTGQRSNSKSEFKMRNITRWFSELRFPVPTVFDTAYRFVLKLFSRLKTKSDHPLTKKEKEEQIVEGRVDAAVKKVFGDDDNFRHIAEMVSLYLKYNPRRVKQFVNLFRLRYVTAMSTNLFKQEDGKLLTFEQLGKFVGIGLGWPLFIKELEQNYKLLGELADFAEKEKKPGKVAEGIKEWKEEEKLIGLIKSGCFDKDNKKKKKGEYERFSMRRLDVEKLMKVAPRVEEPIE